MNKIFQSMLYIINLSKIISEEYILAFQLIFLTFRCNYSVNVLYQIRQILIT